MRMANLIAVVATALMVGAAGMDVTAEEESEDGPTAAPDFTLKDHHGKEVKLSDYHDKIVVLEWINPQCPYVVRHYNEKTFTTLAHDYKDKGVVHLAINSSHFNKPENSAEWAEKHDISYPILDDAAGDVGRAYGARTTPHMFIVKDGLIVYNGAIDDDAPGAKDVAHRVNYVRQALDELLAQSAVSVPLTQPYGCSVKYAK